MKFIYVFSQEDRENLLNKGFNEITSCKIGDKQSTQLRVQVIYYKDA